MDCLVDGAEAARTEFVEQCVLACRVAAGNRVGLSRMVLLAGSWRKVSITWFPETIAGRRHGGLSQSLAFDTCTLHETRVRVIIISHPPVSTISQKSVP